MQADSFAVEHDFSYSMVIHLKVPGVIDDIGQKHYRDSKYYPCVTVINITFSRGVGIINHTVMSSKHSFTNKVREKSCVD